MRGSSVAKLAVLGLWLSAVASAETTFYLKGAPASSKVDPSCTLESITNSCSLFDPARGDVIRLPDGTMIPNFSAIYRVTERKRLVEEFRKSTDRAVERGGRVLAMKTSLNALIKGIDDRRMHPTFKVFFVDNFDGILKILVSAPDAPARMRMPPSPAKLGKPQILKAEVVRKILQPLFNDAQFMQLRILAQSLASMSEPDNTLGNATLREMLNVTPKRRKYIEKLVAFSREAIVDMLMDGRPMKGLNPAELSSVRKVETVRYRDAFDPVFGLRIRKHNMCRSPIPNAFYSPQDHSINLCPNLYNFPDSTIVSVVAHEIAHVIDPCNSQFGLYRLDFERLDNLRRSANERRIASFSGDNHKFLLFSVLDGLPRTEGKVYTALPFPLLFPNESIRYFEQADILQAETKGTAFADYVLKDVFECLKGQGSFKSYGSDELRGIAHEVVELRKNSRDATYDAPADEQKIVNAFSAYPECLGLERHSQLGEATADWVSSKVLGRFLRGMNLDNYLERLGPIAFFGNLVCMERQGLRDAQEETVGTILTAAWKDYGKTRDSHPVGKDRIDRIYLADKEIRRALGCPEATTQVACEHSAAPSAPR